MLPKVLTIAGSDSGGGAGVQADLKVFTVFGVYGSSVITALTAQNTLGVSGIHAVPSMFVRAQLDAVLGDIGADAIKTGMLANAEITAEVARALRHYAVPRVVVDPVLLAQSGAALLDDDAVTVLCRDLIPLAELVTPNAPEAARLAELEVHSLDDLRRAARAIVRMGARAVLAKGGHLTGAESVDILDDGETVRELRSTRLVTRNTHGTGCQLSAAIAAGLAAGESLISAVNEAKRFISAAIAAGIDIGAGDGPANPLVWLRTRREGR